jgi:ATP-dependent DNA ligase
MLWRVSSPRHYPAGFIEPCLPTVSKRVPEGPHWIHEIKHDGYRMIVRRDGDRVRLFTRRGHDWTHRFGWIVHSFAPPVQCFVRRRCDSGLLWPLPTIMTQGRGSPATN